MFILGSFISLSNNLQHTAHELQKNLVAVFYLKKNLPEKEVNNIKESLETSPLVDSIQFITSEQALEKFNNNFPELREILNNLEIKRFIEVDRLNRSYKVKQGLKLLI